MTTYKRRAINRSSNGRMGYIKVFKNGPSKICGRQATEADHITSYSLKVVFHEFYLVHS